MVKIMKVTKKQSTTETAAVAVYEDDPPDGGWGWVVVVAAHLALLFSQGSLTGFGPFIIRLREYFECGAGEIAGVSGTALFVTLATGPISSALNSCFGCRAVVMAGGLVSTIGTVISSFATEISHLYVTYGVITGFGYGLVATPSVAFIARYFKKRYALANGIVFSAFGIGWIALPQLYQLFINHFGWRQAMMFLAALDLQICVCGALFRPPPQKRTIRVEPVVSSAAANTTQDLSLVITLTPTLLPIDYIRDKNALKDAQPTNSRLRAAFYFTKYLQTLRKSKCCHFFTKMIEFSLFTNANFVLMAIAYFIIAIGFYPTILFLVARAESFGIPYPLPTTLMTITGTVSLLGRASHGCLVDLGAMTPVRATASSLLVCGLVNIFSVFVRRYIGLACLYGVFGLANGVYHPLLAVTLKLFVGVSKLPAALGFCNLCHGIGALIGPPIAGWILDQSHNYNFCYLFSGIILVLSAVMLFVAPYTVERCRRQRCERNSKKPEQSSISGSPVEVVFDVVTTL
ncbi:monocarboxylate transporter 13-like [Ptychodera flava]|uniref:monocarboxylate transporter 13-like n=1 Tax=Ptychodera flava TaxID=63121 RepID=UPI00396A3EC8